jgi:ferredoxin like protein
MSDAEGKKPDNMSLEDKLYRTKYEPDTDNSHIEVNQEECKTCKDKQCVTLCPAGVYKKNPNDEDEVIASHDNCLECGTCVKLCKKDAIDWKYPDGAMGVKYRNG